ncbi:hypothetical protein [uncultured Pseudokineococcus sp.]|uniref:hypothetical protein n=1 Tax=uncultured Pseudokineococcus sp. TaxID=1642928 RepID=UPI002612573F|nr:hypothetical protein [uncultured Pseudokineococcus sp.]
MRAADLVPVNAYSDATSADLQGEIFVSQAQPNASAAPPDEDELSAERQPVPPLVALRRHWALGTVLVLAGTAVGGAVGVLLPDSYTSESRIAVGSNDLAALSVPGYAYAAGQLAASTARYVDNSQALGALEPVLGEDAASVTDVSASPIPASNIIRVEVTAGEEGVATRGAATVTDYLLEQANRVNSSSDGEQLLQQYAELSRQVAEVTAARDAAVAAAETASAVVPPSAAVQAQAVDLTAQLDVLLRRQEALGAQYEDAVTADDLSYQLITVAEAAPSFHNAASQIQRYGLLGFVAGLLGALLAGVLLERRGRRRPSASGASEVEEGAPAGDELELLADRRTDSPDGERLPTGRR